MRKRREVSFMQKLVEQVKKRGTASVEDMALEFPGKTRSQLQAAFGNARDAGLLKQKVRGSFRAKRPAVWEAGGEWRSRRRVPAPLCPLPSVWALGSPPEFAEWPPAFPAARRYQPLGPWTEATAP